MTIRLAGTGYNFLLVLFPVLFYCYCGINTAGGFETTNGVRIVVCADSIKGIAVPGSQVIVCDTSYVAPSLTRESFVDTVYADQNGHFKFNFLKNGRYNLIARSRDLDKGALITKIDIDKANQVQHSDTAEFLSLGSISGIVISDSIIEYNCIVYSKGVAISANTDTLGNYRLSSVPPGIYRLQAYQKVSRGIEIFIYNATRDSVLVGEASNETGVDLKLNQLK